MAAAAAAAAAAIHGGNPNAAALALAAATNHQNGGSAGGHGLPPPLIKGEKGGATGDVSPARSHHSRSSPMHERYKNYLKSCSTLSIVLCICITHMIAILMVRFVQSSQVDEISWRSLFQRINSFDISNKSKTRITLWT